MKNIQIDRWARAKLGKKVIYEELSKVANMIDGGDIVDDEVIKGIIADALNHFRPTAPKAGRTAFQVMEKMTAEVKKRKGRPDLANIFVIEGHAYGTCGYTGLRIATDKTDGIYSPEGRKIATLEQAGGAHQFSRYSSLWSTESTDVFTDITDVVFTMSQKSDDKPRINITMPNSDRPRAFDLKLWHVMESYEHAMKAFSLDDTKLSIEYEDGARGVIAASNDKKEGS